MKTARPAAPRIATLSEDLSVHARYESWRRSFATADLPLEKLEAVGRTRMHPRHNKLNALLDRE